MVGTEAEAEEPKPMAPFEEEAGVEEVCGLELLILVEETKTPDASEIADEGGYAMVGEP